MDCQCVGPVTDLGQADAGFLEYIARFHAGAFEGLAGIIDMLND